MGSYRNLELIFFHTASLLRLLSSVSLANSLQCTKVQQNSGLRSAIWQHHRLALKLLPEHTVIQFVLPWIVQWLAFCFASRCCEHEDAAKECGLPGRDRRFELQESVGDHWYCHFCAWRWSRSRLDHLRLQKEHVDNVDDPNWLVTKETMSLIAALRLLKERTLAVCVAPWLHILKPWSWMARG